MSTVSSVDTLTPIMPGNPDYGIQDVQEKVDELVGLIKSGDLGGKETPLTPVMPVEKNEYESGRNVIYDLTGSDPRFCKKQQLMIFTARQIHTFPTPVHAASIKVRVYQDEEWRSIPKAGAVGSTATNAWRVVELAMDTMSSAYRMDATFTGEFVKSIEIDLLEEGASASDRIIVTVEAQCAYVGLYELHEFDGVGPSYTPALGRFMLEKLDDLSALITANIANTFASTDNVNDMLPEDLTGVSPKNYVEFESHSVRTTDGIDTIMPARGACYDHDFQMWKYSIRTGTVQMSNKLYNLENRAIFMYTDTSPVGTTTSKITATKRVYLTNENYDEYIGVAGSFIDRAKLVPMIRGVDYELVNLNVAKTELSSSEHGVYDSVRLLKSFVGDVLISYHSFGGEVVFNDVRDLRQNIINVMKILTSKKLLTADVIEKQPVVKDLIRRIQVVEQYHDHFNRVEHAIYMNNPGFHWFNIATLYDAQWDDTEPITDEIGTFRVESKVLKWCYEFSLGIDLKKKLADMLRCKTLMCTDVHTTNFSDYVKYLTNREDVAVRLCWMGDGSQSGVVLQLGWDFSRYSKYADEEGRISVQGVTNDVVIVTNKSGMTSKWKLVYNPMDNTYESSSAVKAYNHTEFVPTSDVTYLADKDYFKLDEVYVYYRTADVRIKGTSKYFTRDSADKFIPVLLAENELVDKYTNEEIMSLDGISCRKGVFERSISRRVPKKLYADVDYVVGAAVPSDASVYQVKNSHSEDDIVQMPNERLKWYKHTHGCHDASSVLEPSDGLVAWVGNIPLVPTTTEGPTKLRCSLSKNTQDIISITSIKGVNIWLYDRKLDRILNRSVDIGCMEAEYEAVEVGHVVDGSIKYFLRTSVSTEAGPYMYYPVELTPGTVISDSNLYFRERTTSRIIGQVMLDMLDCCGTNIVISKDGKGNINHQLVSYVGTDSAINQRFDIRQIDYHF